MIKVARLLSSVANRQVLKSVHIFQIEFSIVAETEAANRDCSQRRAIGNGKSLSLISRSIRRLRKRVFSYYYNLKQRQIAQFKGPHSGTAIISNDNLLQLSIQIPPLK